MPRTRSILFVKLLEQGDADEDAAPPSMLSAVPLGTTRQITEQLAPFNTAPDGDPATQGILFGPGFTVQLPMTGERDPVQQVMVTLDEEDMAWPVITRLCRTLRWKLMDPNSGRIFGAG